MREMLQFYIDGQWVDPAVANPLDVINPATEEVCGRISLGSATDVDKAVAAAKRALPAWSRTSREERIALLERILEEFAKRHDDVATAIMEEMGAPWKLARFAQAGSGPEHIQAAIDALRTFPIRRTAWHDADHQRTHRRLRAYYPVELADEPGRSQGCPGAGRRLHDGPEAQ